FTLSSFVIDLVANPANGGITITALGAGGTAIDQQGFPKFPQDPLDPGIILPNGDFYFLISEASPITGFRVSNGDAVVYEGGNYSGLTTTVGAAAVPEPGPAIMIFAAMLLFALRALAQRYGLWRDRLERNRITGRT